MGGFQVGRSYIRSMGRVDSNVPMQQQWPCWCKQWKSNRLLCSCVCLSGVQGWIMRGLGWRNGAENTKLFDSTTRQLRFIIYFAKMQQKFQDGRTVFMYRSNWLTDFVIQHRYMPVCDGTQNLKRYRYFFLVPSIFDTDTFSGTNFCRYRYFLLVLNIFDTDTDTFYRYQRCTILLPIPSIKVFLACYISTSIFVLHEDFYYDHKDLHCVNG